MKGGHIMKSGHKNEIKQTNISPPIIVKKRHRGNNSPRAVTVYLKSSGPEGKSNVLKEPLSRVPITTNDDMKEKMEVQSSTVNENKEASDDAQ